MRFRCNQLQPKNQKEIRHIVDLHEQQWFRNDWEMQSIGWRLIYQAESQMGWLVEATQRQMLPGNNPVASQLNYKEGGHLSGTQGSQVYTWGEGTWEYDNMWACYRKKTIIFKAIVHSKTKRFSCCSNPYDLLSWNTKGEIGQSFSYNETEWGYVQSSSKINVFSKNKYLYVGPTSHKVILWLLKIHLHHIYDTFIAFYV